MNSVTITVRIPKELKEELSRYGIKVSSVVRKALEGIENVVKEYVDRKCFLGCATCIAGLYMGFHI